MLSGTHEKQRCRAAAIDVSSVGPSERASSSSKVILNAVRKQGKYALGLEQQVMQNFTDPRYEALFSTKYVFRNVLDPCKQFHIHDHEWKMAMEYSERCASTFLMHLSSMHRLTNPGKPPTRCCYIMTLDLGKYVFAHNLPERVEFALYVAALIYGGEGWEREPQLKYQLAEKYRIASNAERANSKIFPQPALYERILEEWTDGHIHKSYIAEGIYRSYYLNLSASRKVVYIKMSCIFNRRYPPDIGYPIEMIFAYHFNRLLCGWSIENCVVLYSRSLASQL